MPSKPRYDVFLSFRGSDTRPNFTSHLYDALRRKNIKTFRDDKLVRGEEISSTLLTIIEGSKIAVIVFSENYADSKWCLDELVKIMECKKVMGQIVLPIFYHVDPADVESQTGNFGKAFRQVQEEFNHSDIVQSWKTALTEAANLSGWDSNNYSLEANLCDEVACHIKKLCPISFTASPYLVGIDSLAEKIISYLCIGELDVRYVGLWGMGGIGKTTIAEYVHTQISNHFDKYCIFRDVREKSEKFDLLHLRRSFISLLLGGGTEDIQGLNELPTHILDELGEKKILVVLDDLNNPNQLEALGVSDGWFGSGSRIIITSRDEQVLRNGGVDRIYEVKGLKSSDACKLLQMKAFPKTDPNESYALLLKRVVDYCKGIPLALKVLGSQLCQKSPHEWECLLEKIHQCGDSDIMAILRISYDTLDQIEKTIFLDVACFYKECNENWLRRTFYGCDCSLRCACCCSSNWALIRLKEKCLITIDDDKIVRMHDLIEEMGKNIAGKEGSRLWNSKEICHLLKTNKGSEAIEGIVFVMDERRKILLHPQVFSRMPNLRILQFQPRQEDEQVEFILEPKKSNLLPSLSDKLSSIRWPNYPFKSLPSTFSMENLVELCIESSDITQLWDGDKCPQNLKSLFLYDCRQLMKLPDLSSATKLCLMSIHCCKNLEEINSSIKCLCKLIALYLEGCEKLTSLPSLAELECLKILVLSECSNLKMLPILPKHIQKLKLDNSGVEEWSSLIQGLEYLDLVTMRSCRNITSIPSSILLKFKEENGDSLYDYWFMGNHDDTHHHYKLDFSDSRNLRSLPIIKGYLLEVNLHGTGIEELPLLDGLVSLKKLNLSGCSELVRLPPLDALTFLEILDLEGCSKLVGLLPLDGLSSLRVLNLRCCSALVELPPLHGLVSLEELDLIGCSRLATLPPLHGLRRLQVMKLGWNYTFVEVPNDIVSLSWLSSLSVRECEQLHRLPKLPDQLTNLQVVGCPSLINVVSTPNRQRFYGYYELSYINCMNLNQNTRSCIMADAHSIAKQLAIVAKRRFEYGGYKVGTAGNEIPEWVLNQSQGSSIEIELPSDSLSAENLLGFVFFVVLDFHHGIYSWLDLRIEVNSIFKDTCSEYEKKLSSLFTLRNIDVIPLSDHIFFLYNSLEWMGRVEVINGWVMKNGFRVKGEFHFVASSVAAHRYVNVKKCGVCPIYEQADRIQG